MYEVVVSCCHDYFLAGYGYLSGAECAETVPIAVVDQLPDSFDDFECKILTANIHEAYKCIETGVCDACSTGTPIL